MPDRVIHVYRLNITQKYGFFFPLLARSYIEKCFYKKGEKRRICYFAFSLAFVFIVATPEITDRVIMQRYLRGRGGGQGEIVCEG